LGKASTVKVNGKDYGWSEITCKIFDGFIEKYNADFIVLD
jgi:hypothetical protein